MSERLPGGVRGRGWELAAGHWDEGEAIFRHTCSLCHETGVGPELRSRQLPAEAIAAIVRNGNGATLAVRQSELSDAEVDRVSKWIEASTAPKALGEKAMKDSFTRRAVLASGIAGGGLAAASPLFARTPYIPDDAKPTVLVLTEDGDEGGRFAEGIRRSGEGAARQIITSPVSMLDYGATFAKFASADIVVGLTSDLSYLLIVEMCRNAGARLAFKGTHRFFEGQGSRHDIQSAETTSSVGRLVAVALSCVGLPYAVEEGVGNGVTCQRNVPLPQRAAPPHDGDWRIALASSYLDAVNGRIGSPASLDRISRGNLPMADGSRVSIFRFH